METYQIIKKFLADDGKCLLIEDGKPIGVVLAISEFENLTKNSNKEAAGLSIDETKQSKFDGESESEVPAEIADIEAGDNVILEDLGLDEITE